MRVRATLAVRNFRAGRRCRPRPLMEPPDDRDMVAQTRLCSRWRQPRECDHSLGGVRRPPASWPPVRPVRGGTARLDGIALALRCLDRAQPSCAKWRATARRWSSFTTKWTSPATLRPGWYSSTSARPSRLGRRVSSSRRRQLLARASSSSATLPRAPHQSQSVTRMP